MNMKKLILAVLTFAASTAFATTYTPVQLLNPAGSTAGQAIVSTGPNSAPTWGGVAVSGLAAIGANTVLANATNASASPTAFAMPSTCTSGSLQWTSGTGFVCSSSLSATTINASGLITPTSTIGIKGTATNDSAQAGSVGEYASNSTSGTPLTTGTTANATSETLTAGDWDVECSVLYSPAGGASYTTVNSGVSTTSASFTIAQGNAGMGFPANTSTAGWTIVTPVVRISQASSGTVYCVANSTFTIGTMSVTGYIRARRIR
jgi:hypothetical protein